MAQVGRSPSNYNFCLCCVLLFSYLHPGDGV